MNEIRLASMAFAAYLVTSADAMSMNRTGLPVRTNGSYKRAITSLASSLSTPMTTRSGFMKSSTALPSLRNSGLEPTALPSLRNSGLEQRKNGVSVSAWIARLTFSAVSTGTVDLVTTTVGWVRCRPMVRATSNTCWRSADPSSSGGVPTAMKTTSQVSTAAPTSVVN